MKITHLFFRSLLLAFVACTSKVETIETAEIGHSRSQTPSPELASIDSLMWQRPDSALLILMEYEGDSNVFNGHYAQLLASELLFKNDCAQTNRAELLQAVAYFDSIMDLHGADTRGVSLRPDPRRDTSHASAKTLAFLDARAHYINGAGYYEQGDLVNACAEYLNTLRIMENHFAENELVGKKARFMALTYGRLCDLLTEQFMTEFAIVCYKKCLVFNLIESTSATGIAKVLASLGQQYDILKQTDSAGYYYNEAFKYLPDTNNLVYRDLISGLAVYNYYSGKGVEPAVCDIKRMAAQTTDEDERLTRYFTIGSIYFENSQYDSALVYLATVFENKDNVGFKRDAARSLHDIFQIKGDSLKAAQYAHYQVENSVHEGEINRQVSQLNDLFQNYLQEKQEAASLRERRKAVRLTLMVLVPLLVAIGLAVAIVMRRRHKKRLEAQEAEAQQRLEAERQSHRMEQAALSGRLKRSNETLRELQDQVRQQGETAPKPETQAATFAEEPICRLIMQRVNEGQFKSQMDCTVYKDYALGREQVAALREAAYRHFNQFTSRIAKAYPDLTRSDLDYCCLYLLGLSDADIAALMQRAYNTVSQRARKMKAIFGSDEPITVVLRGFASV